MATKRRPRTGRLEEEKRIQDGIAGQEEMLTTRIYREKSQDILKTARAQVYRKLGHAVASQRGFTEQKRRL